MKSIVIDLARCNGCYNCQIACKDEHCHNDWSPIAQQQPMSGQFWCKVTERELGRVPWVRVEYKPVMCAHCDEAPCVEASNGACYRRDDGLVILDPEKSKGMKELVDSCPQGLIFWNEELEIPQKCTGCAHLLDDGWEVPRCVDACGVGAMQYIDVENDTELIAHAIVPEQLKQFGPHLYYLNPIQSKVVGSLVDKQEDEALIGVGVKLIDSKTNKLVSEVETDEFGDFEFFDVSAGTYRVEAHIQDFEEVVLQATVTDNDTVLGEQYLSRITE